MNDGTRNLETTRLRLRNAALPDESFFLRLLNEPSWLENIGDRCVRSLADAESYIRSKIWPQHETSGYGMYVVELKSREIPIGICGLVKRDYLSAPDLGFALLPEYVGQGFATEAARCVMSHARATWSIPRLYAVTRRGNERSLRLLDRIGFRYEGPCMTPQGAEVELFAAN
ncbi:MAG TPA: GNAT family N-acetyltransferase [Steroidobacteraceae bacterium]|nr:GNAT family N-acetyltransferase [Steroidobacteraceae bacterium]